MSLSISMIENTFVNISCNRCGNNQRPANALTRRSKQHRALHVAPSSAGFSIGQFSDWFSSLKATRVITVGEIMVAFHHHLLAIIFLSSRIVSEEKGWSLPNCNVVRHTRASLLDGKQWFVCRNVTCIHIKENAVTILNALIGHVN